MLGVPPRVLGIPHRVLGVPHRVLGVLHRVLGVLHRVLGVLRRVLGALQCGACLSRPSFQAEETFKDLGLNEMTKQWMSALEVIARKRDRPSREESVTNLYNMWCQYDHLMETFDVLSPSLPLPCP